MFTMTALSHVLKRACVQSARCFATITRPTNIREVEQAQLKSLLTAEPIKPILLTGPQSCGKTTFGRQVFREFLYGEAYDFREGPANAQCVADSIFETFSSVSSRVRKAYGLDGGLRGVKATLDGKESDVYQSPTSKARLPMKMFRTLAEDLRELKAAAAKNDGLFPVLFFDQIDRVHEMAITDPAFLSDLFAFVVKVSKQEQLCNVLVASSDCFFSEVLQSFGVDKYFKHIDFGHLDKVHACSYMSERGVPKEFHDAIFDVVGGKVYDIGLAIAHLARRKLLLPTVQGDVKQVRVALDGMDDVAVERARFEEALRPSFGAALAKTYGAPVWNQKSLVAVLEELVGSNNFLSLDRVMSKLGLEKSEALRLVGSMVRYNLLCQRGPTSLSNDVECDGRTNHYTAFSPLAFYALKTGGLEEARKTNAHKM